MIADVIMNLKSKVSRQQPNPIFRIFMRLINIEIPELEKIVKDEEQPPLVRIAGKNLLGKGFDIIEKDA